VLEGSSARHASTAVVGATAMVIASAASSDLAWCIRH